MYLISNLPSQIQIATAPTAPCTVARSIGSVVRSLNRNNTSRARPGSAPSKHPIASFNAFTRKSPSCPARCTRSKKAARSINFDLASMKPKSTRFTGCGDCHDNDIPNATPPTPPLNPKKQRCSNPGHRDHDHALPHPPCPTPAPAADPAPSAPPTATSPAPPPHPQSPAAPPSANSHQTSSS